MSILNDLSTDTGAANAALVAIIKGRLARDFWRWYVVHEEDEVASVGVLLFRVKIRVKTLRPFWVLFFGSPTE